MNLALLFKMHLVAYSDLYPKCIARHTLRIGKENDHILDHVLFNDGHIATVYYLLIDSGRLQGFRRKVFDLAVSINPDFAARMDLSQSFFLPLGYSGHYNPMTPNFYLPTQPEYCVMGLELPPQL